MTEKPSIEKVTLIPDQPLTPQEKQDCITFLRNYEPKIHWEVGQKVIAYIGTKIITLYIRSIDPRTVFFGYLPEEGEINIEDHKQIGTTPTPITEKQEDKPQAFKQPMRETTETEPLKIDPVLIIYRVPPSMEIEIKIKTTKK